MNNPGQVSGKDKYIMWAGGGYLLPRLSLGGNEMPLWLHIIICIISFGIGFLIGWFKAAAKNN